jgi:ketosteroid isomerase-like protein
MTPTATDTRAAIDAYINALQGGDEDALRAAFHPDATWWLPGELPVSRTWEGRDAILGELLPAVMARFRPDSLAFTTHSVIVEDERAVLEWSVRAVTVDGKDYDNSYLAVFEYRAGAIAAVREYMATGVMARVLFPNG